MAIFVHTTSIHKRQMLYALLDAEHPHPLQEQRQHRQPMPTFLEDLLTQPPQRDNLRLDEQLRRDFGRPPRTRHRRRRPPIRRNNNQTLLPKLGRNQVYVYGAKPDNNLRAINL